MNRRKRRKAERARDAYEAACVADSEAYEAWRDAYACERATRDEAWHAYEVTQRARSAAFIAYCDAFPALRESAQRSGLYPNAQ